MLTGIVVNWRTPDLAVRAVRALVDDGLPMERIVVVDNASGDGSGARLRAELSGAVLLELDENVGYARANNAAARRLPGEAYFLVNSDAFVHRRGSVHALIGALDDPTVGVVAARLLNQDGSVQPNVGPLPSPAVALVQASGLSRFVPDRWQPSWSTYWQHGSEREIESATGAVLLVRGATWEALGGFDESAFMYAEDRDLCWRARKAGWRVWFRPDAEFVHIGSATVSGRWTSASRAERVGAAEAAMIRRELRRPSAAATLAFIRGGLLARSVAARALGSRDRAAVFAGGYRGYSSSEPSSEDV